MVVVRQQSPCTRLLAQHGYNSTSHSIVHQRLVDLPSELLDRRKRLCRPKRVFAVVLQELASQSRFKAIHLQVLLRTSLQSEFPGVLQCDEQAPPVSRKSIHHTA